MTWVDDGRPLPPAAAALGEDSDAPGLVAAGGQVTPERLEEAYGSGIFPWYSPGQPVLWWSPDPRMVLPVAQFRVSHSLRKTLRRFVRTPGCEVHIDRSFDAVIQACAGTPRAGQDGTWIVPEMVAAYRAWHRAGRVHSVETWVQGRLVGGLYAVGLGHMVFGESMFAHATDASKIALAALVCLCREHRVPLIDCQQNTGHLASLGAHEIPRAAFLAHLFAHRSDTAGGTAPVEWTYHPALWRHLIEQPDNPA